MNRRNFFKAAGAVVVGGLVGAQVQASAEPDTGALRMAREAEDRALRLERMSEDHQAQLDEALRVDAMRLEQMVEEINRQFARTLEGMA